MFRRLKEAFRGEPNPLVDTWTARCQEQKKIDARVTVFTGKERNKRFFHVFILTYFLGRHQERILKNVKL